MRKSRFSESQIVAILKQADADGVLAAKNRRPSVPSTPAMSGPTTS